MLWVVAGSTIFALALAVLWVIWDTYLDRLPDAAANGDVAAVRRLLPKERNPGIRRRALHNAICRQHDDVVQVFLEQGTDVTVPVKKWSGLTALHVAASQGTPRAVEA